MTGTVEFSVCRERDRVVIRGEFTVDDARWHVAMTDDVARALSAALLARAG